MKSEVDKVIERLLHADDDFLIEVGRLTLLFSRIEDDLVESIVFLASTTNNEQIKSEATRKRIAQLRLLEKRDFLKRVVADVGRFYDVDHTRVIKVLDELGNLNRLRRSIVHGFIRWSVADEQPVFVDSHSHSVPGWPRNVAETNVKVISWLQDLWREQGVLCRSVMLAYDRLADQLLNRPNLPPQFRELFESLKRKAADVLEKPDAEPEQS